MAKIIGTHKDSGFASACQNKLQIEVTRWDSEPTAAQLAEHPNSEWSKDSSGTVVFDNYKGRYDEKPVRSTPLQTNGVDRFIWAVALAPFVCLFVAWCLRGN